MCATETQTLSRTHTHTNEHTKINTIHIISGFIISMLCGSQFLTISLNHMLKYSILFSLLAKSIYHTWTFRVGYYYFISTNDTEAQLTGKVSLFW